jgi:flagellar hook-associated protein 2
MSSLFGAGVCESGTDAVVRLSADGSTDESDQITLTRSSNTFDVNGTTVKLLGKASGNTEEGINIGLGYDAKANADKISLFISDYNDLLGSMTTLTSEEAYSDYPPLTDDQKSDLSETEQKLWTEKAKSGILRNDTYLSSIETELRSSMYTIVDGLDSLTSAGITTGTYNEKGKLHIDTDKLSKALSENAEETLSLFTKESGMAFSLYATTEQQETRFEENGVLSRISDIIKKNLNTVGKKGALIMLVGSPSSSYSTESDYGKQIKDLDIKLLELKTSAGMACLQNRLESYKKLPNH